MTTNMQCVPTIKVASYNICNTAYANNFKEEFDKKHFGNDHWDKRYPTLIDNIRNINADILALQECNPANARDRLKQDLGDRYEMCFQPHVNRYTDGVAILYDKTRFTKVAQNKSDFTGEKPNGVDKTHLSVDLRDNLTNRVIRVATSHIYGNPDITTPTRIVNMHLESYRKFVETNLEKVDDVIVTGDFNFTIEGFKGIFPNNGYRTDGCYNATEPKKDRRIDFIFKKRAKNDDEQVNPLLSNANYSGKAKLYNYDNGASDHLPAITEFLPAEYLKQEFGKLSSETKMHERLATMIRWSQSRQEKSEHDDFKYVKENFAQEGFDENERNMLFLTTSTLPDGTNIKALDDAFTAACTNEVSQKKVEKEKPKTEDKPKAVTTTGQGDKVSQSSDKEKPITTEKPKTDSKVVVKPKNNGKEQSWCSWFCESVGNFFKGIGRWLASWFN